jgi:hypothetical protein
MQINLAASKQEGEQLKDGMRTLEHDGIKNAFIGPTDYEQLLRINIYLTQKYPLNNSLLSFN